MQPGTSQVHQKKIREQKLLSWEKLDSISKAHIFLFPNNAH